MATTHAIRLPHVPVQRSLRRLPHVASRTALGEWIPVIPLLPQFRLVAKRAAVLVALPLPSVALMHIVVRSNALLEGAALVLTAILVSSVQILRERRILVSAGGMQAGAATAASRAGMPANASALELGQRQVSDDKAFEDAVRRALTHLADPTKLALSPLVHLTLVTKGLAEYDLTDTCLHRASILAGLLEGMVEELRPRQLEGSHTGEAWRFYNCLYYPYVARISRRSAPTVLRELRERRERDGGPLGEQEQVVTWLLQVDEDTCYKWQRRASDTIARGLREREMLLSDCSARAGHADVA